VIDPAAANEALREGIDGGGEAPLIVLRHDPNDVELEQMLEDLPLDRISTHFTHLHPDKQPVTLLHQFRALAEKRGLDPRSLRGSIDFDPMLDWARPPYDQLAETIRFCDDNMPHFRMLQANGLRFHAGIENTTMELGYIAAKGSEYLAQLHQRGIPPATTNRALQFSLAISTSYFVDIAKLRAFRRLWANVLAAYGAPQAALPPIVAHLARETQTDDPNTNMIKAGTQAMAAVLGGAARLYIRPANFPLKEPPSPFHRRIARNVQHILRLESYLDRVIDPAAGSYYIEKLTEKLAEKAWTRFQELEQQGEFA